MNTYNEAKAARDSAEERLKIASLALGRYPKGAIGLTPNDVKETPEWQKDMTEYNAAFAALRAINGVIVKKFHTEYRSERNAREQMK